VPVAISTKGTKDRKEIQLRPPIGVFDSGVGGLSVLREIRRQLPGADLVYVADSRYVPYGTQPPDLIRQRSLDITKYLVDHEQAAVVVVACNTATTHAVELLRQRFPNTPIVGMEPGIKPAVRATATRVVGVLATGSTLDSRRFEALVDRTAEGVEVLTQPCPGLVERVEIGDLAGPATVELLQRYVTPLVERGTDVIVLGCTHYPFLRPVLEQIVGPSVRVLDTSVAVARQTAKLWPGSLTQRSGTVAFLTSGDPRQVREVFERLWGEPIRDVLRLASVSA
jgi:glutamate racemase